MKMLASLVLLGMTSLAHSFEPQLELQHSISLRPTLYGKTNLPDGAQLMVTVSRPEVQYLAQAKVTVRNGKFVAAGFSNKGQALVPGQYTVVFALVAAALNPPNVRSVIGDRGEKLTGPWVKKGVIDEKEFTYRGTFPVSEPQPPANLRVERSPYLEREVISRCKDAVIARQQAIQSGMPGTVVRGEALREQVRECIRTALGPENGPFAVERFEQEG